MNNNFTITETFTANRGRQFSKNVTVEQRYHGKQVITYRVVETGDVYGSDQFWNAGFVRVN